MPKLSKAQGGPRFILSQAFLWNRRHSQFKSLLKKPQNLSNLRTSVSPRAKVQTFRRKSGLKTFICNCWQGPAAVTRTPGAGPSWETGLQVEQTTLLLICKQHRHQKKRRTSCLRLNGAAHKVHIYLEYQCLSPRPNWDSLSRNRVCTFPPEPKGGTHSPASEGEGGTTGEKA